MRNRFGIIVAAGLLLAAGSVFAQTSAPTGVAQAAPAAAASTASPTFDVASVRPSAPLDPVKIQAQMAAGKMPNFGAQVDGGRAQYSYMSLRDLIANAYGVKAYQITGPDWLNVQRFDIVATLPEGASKDDAPKMLQALLADRFKLKTHSETKDQPVLALVVAKGGPKLTKSATAAVAFTDDTPLKPGEMQMNGPDGPMRVTQHPDGSAVINMGAKGTMTQKMDMQSQTLHLDSTNLSMAGFADMLTNVMKMGGPSGRQVVDMTELKGEYEVALDISMADIIAAARNAGMNVPGGAPAGGAAVGEASDPGGGGSTVYGSVEKLGLKLEARKAPVTQLVVDSAEKNPTDN